MHNAEPMPAPIFVDKGVSVALPRVAVAALGGTICMAPDGQSDGVMPKLSAQQLLDAIPNLGAVAQLEAQTLRQLPSPSLSFDDRLEVLRGAAEQVAQGAAGVVSPSQNFEQIVERQRRTGQLPQ